MTPIEEFERHLQQLNSTAIGRRAFLGMVPVLLTACATAQHRQREGDNTGQETPITVNDEKKMAQEVMPQMQKDYPPLPNPELQNYIRGLGSRLVRANQLDGQPYRYQFTVVGVNQVNAFALPAGQIFVTAPLLAMSETEAELAGVVGHEVGHVKSRHTAERISKAKKAEGSSWLYGAGGGLLGGVMGFGLGKLLCKKGDTACLVKTTGLGAAAGVGGGLLVQKYYFMANSREDEMEADRVGFRTSLHTGYHKDHVGTFYTKLQEMEKAHKEKNIPLLSGLADALSTHPPSDERVQQMQQLAAQARNSGRAIVSSKEFDRARKIAKDWVRENQKS